MVQLYDISTTIEIMIADYDNICWLPLILRVELSDTSGSLSRRQVQSVGVLNHFRTNDPNDFLQGRER